MVDVEWGSGERVGWDLYLSCDIPCSIVHYKLIDIPTYRPSISHVEPF